MERKFHHIGIPTDLVRAEENYMADIKTFVSDPSACGANIEWLRFEADSPMPELLKKEAHIAYVVADVEAAMEGKECLMEPFDGGPGVRVGFIIEDGQPVELMSISA
ncbi:VOC family protein [Polycladidibacter stylochi]|uniref:VOC family protein n=1 Tax=Polycladidibacter stylochi TaxID=1807766 RepID=UPI00082B73E8|nr:glyoxalase/bleomycin resistance/dioxygenase family protein [Pseudovibrio stylochi]